MRTRTGTGVLEQSKNAYGREDCGTKSRFALRQLRNTQRRVHALNNATCVGTAGRYSAGCGMVAQCDYVRVSGDFCYLARGIALDAAFWEGLA
jgi:hypothetical protein